MFERLSARDDGIEFGVTAQLPNGMQARGVFKADRPRLKTKAAAIAAAMGIDGQRPNSSLRSVAASRLNRLLGLHVIPLTHPVARNGELVGCFMQEAPGVQVLSTDDKSVRMTRQDADVLRAHPDELRRFALDHGFTDVEIEADPDKLYPAVTLINGRRDPDGLPLGMLNQIDLDDPDTRRETNNLEWFDRIAGQCDRHLQNIFVGRIGPGPMRVTGIDGDLAFGLTTSDDEGQPVGLFPNPPAIIDERTRDSILNLTTVRLAADLEGLLTDAEIAAARQRLIDTQRLLRQTDEHGNLVVRVMRSREDWSADDVTTSLGIERLHGLPSREQAKAVKRMQRAGYFAAMSCFDQVHDLFAGSPDIQGGARYGHGELERLARKLSQANPPD